MSLNRLARFILTCTSITVFSSLCYGQEKIEDNWHQWRGPMATGYSPQGDPPTKWSKDENVKWVVDLPGKGSSTPVVWGDKIFVASAVDTGIKADPKDMPKVDPKFDTKTAAPDTYYEFILQCFRKSDGKLLWQKVANKTVPLQGIHPTHSYAAGSPMIANDRVYVSFCTQGVFCFDFDGNQIWSRDLGQFYSRYGWGEANTVVVADGTVIVPWDQEGPSALFALDAKTGKTKWKVARDEPTNWSTPIVVQANGKTQVIVNATNKVRSYDLKSGDLIWECSGQTLNAIPSPVQAGDAVICMSGYRGATAMAIALDSNGDVSDSKKVLWRNKRSTPYIPSPLLIGNRLYYTSSSRGFITCVDVENGREIWSARLPLGTLYSSPVAAKDRIYLTDRDGKTVVFRDAETYQPLAVNQLPDSIDATPVIVGDRLYLRGHQKLYCIANPG